MATTFKTFLNNDITSTKTLLHEAIPLTGTIASGTYNLGGATSETWSGTNIKNYAHGMFQSVYDYPYLSSSANHIYDLSVGYASASALSGTEATTTQQSKKINMYNQMAQVLAGYDATGSIREFDEDGNLVDSGGGSGAKVRDCIFINFARLLAKDEIKKGSFSLSLGVNATYGDTSDTKVLTVSDASGSNAFKVNSPAGEYGILYASGASTVVKHRGLKPCGLLYYQAGIAVLSASVFNADILSAACILDSGFAAGSTTLLTGSAISGACDALRHRMINMSFNNTTELNSTIYFCRANHNEFNYSSNPTYLSGSKIRVKTKTTDVPVSYITTVGLYSDNNELLAVAKLSEPLKKTPDTEFTIRTRLDY